MQFIFDTIMSWSKMNELNEVASYRYQNKESPLSLNIRVETF
jgi:hypothetical protein